MNAPLKVGLLGFGYASATFHAPLIASTPGLQLAAIASSRPSDVLATWPHVSVMATPAELLAQPDIDLVVVATPNATHAPLAAQALVAGKHVVVDKPFTLNLSEAQDLIALAQSHNRLLSVFHNRRWDSDFLSIRDLLAQGFLGRITHFESHFDRFRPLVRHRWRESAQAGGGLWFDLGPHLVDQALQLFGAPQSLWLDQAQQRDASQTDDWFHAVLSYGQMRVILHATALSAHLAPRFTVHGTRGSLIKQGLDTQEDALKAGQRPGSPAWGRDPNGLELHLLNDVDQMTAYTQPCLHGDYLQYYKQIHDAVTQGKSNPVPPHEALSVMKLIAMGQESARTGCNQMMTEGLSNGAVFTA